MEIIFKNRPTPNIDINLAEDKTTLEIVYRYGEDEGTARVFVSIGSAIELANAIRSYLTLNTNKSDFQNQIDRVELGGGGTDMNPSVRISINHKTPQGKELGQTFFVPEPEAEILAKALERWAKHPDL